MNPTPNRFFHLSLIFLVALNLVPHFSTYTVPTLAVGGLCLVWRLLYEFQYIPLPNVLTKMGLVVTLSYLVFKNYGQILGLEAGSALLICAVSLKLIDRVEYRDAMVLLFLNFMLLLARFFESQSLGMTIFAVFDLIITTALLVQLHNGSQIKFDPQTLFKTGLRLFFQVAPFMVLLFFVFPRFSTGLIAGQRRSNQLKGFSDTMKPGSFSQLAQQDQEAFRVIFNGKEPGPFDLYWRGGILTLDAGMRWEKGELKKVDYQPLESKELLYEQEILLEPFFEKWLFALDRPTRILHNSLVMIRRTESFEGELFRLNKEQNNKIVYRAFSSLQIASKLSKNDRKKYLQTTQVQDPRVNELVHSISEVSSENEERAQELMKFYQKQFRYTLSPGELKTENLGEFLFEKKVGFCEHFAVSFASLMRLANVPSRVVVGFHGGEKNPISNYYLVTSRDAHAWTEIWSDTKNRWIRFDPTFMVAPLRIELGGQVFHSLSESERLLIDEKSLNKGWLKQASLAFDAVATQWNLFLLNYDRQGQLDFFEKIGLKGVNQKKLVPVTLLILLCFYLWIRYKNRQSQVEISEAQKAYLFLRERLAKKGIDKLSFEGPSDFLMRAAKEYPEKQNEINLFRQYYLPAEYGNHPSKENLRILVKNI